MKKITRGLVAVAILLIVSGCISTKDPVTEKLLQERLKSNTKSLSADAEEGENSSLDSKGIGINNNYVILFVPVKITQTGPTKFVGPKKETYEGVPNTDEIRKKLGF